MYTVEQDAIEVRFAHGFLYFFFQFAAKALNFLAPLQVSGVGFLNSDDDGLHDAGEAKFDSFGIPSVIQLKLQIDPDRHIFVPARNIGDDSG